jgi:hypothetical protein
MGYIIKKNAQLYHVIQLERRTNDTEQVGFLLDFTRIFDETGEDWQKKEPGELNAMHRYMKMMT